MQNSIPYYTLLSIALDCVQIPLQEIDANCKFLSLLSLPDLSHYTSCQHYLGEDVCHWCELQHMSATLHRPILTLTQLTFTFLVGVLTLP